MATFREIGNDPIIIDAILAKHPELRQNRSAAIRVALEHWYAAQPPRPAPQAGIGARDEELGEEGDAYSDGA